MDEIIFTKPEFYFHTQKLSLEQRLENIKLSEEEIRIFSRDEKKQDDMRHQLQNPKVKLYW